MGNVDEKDRHMKTGFDVYFEKKMKEPGFARRYYIAKAQVFLDRKKDDLLAAAFFVVIAVAAVLIMIAEFR
jgi:hypothetical protein